MTIYYHHRTLGDGAEGLHIDAMVQAFRELGHTVDVGGMVTASNRSSRAGIVERVRGMLPAAGFELASAALNVSEYVAVFRRLQRQRPDVLYKRHARYDVAALAAANRLGIPSILEVNSLFSVSPYADFEPPAYSALVRRMETRALQRATHVVAVSTPLAEQIRTLGAHHVTVLPNGVDVRRFDPQRADRAGVRARLGLGDRLTIGWCGILRDWHGLDLLLDAARSLADAALLVVGDGPGRQALEARAAAAGMTTRLVITGRVPHGDMPGYLSAMDIAVVAADHTGVASPMKLLEYMAMARAVVAPRTRNILDVAADERTAVLFEPGNVGDLGRALSRLASDVPLRTAIGERARATVERDRTWRGNAEIVLRLLARADDRRPAEQR